MTQGRSLSDECGITCLFYDTTLNTSSSGPFDSTSTLCFMTQNKYNKKLTQIRIDVKSLFKVSDNSKIVGGALHCLKRDCYQSPN